MSRTFNATAQIHARPPAGRHAAVWNASRVVRSSILYDMRYVVLGTAVFIGVYIFLDLNKLYALRYGMDVGIFLQSLVNFAHTGSTFNWVERQPHLTVHDSWALLLLTPIIAIFPRPETLLVVQVVAIGVAAIPLYLFARGAGLASTSAQLVSLAYLIMPSAQGWAYMDFSENVFVPVLAFSLALAAQRRSMLWTLVMAQLLMGVKEDQIWFLAWFGLAGALWYDRKLGAAVLGLALLNAVGYYGIVHALGYNPAAPAYSLRVSLWKEDLASFAEVLAPFAFAPLTLGWRILLAAPLVAEITLNGPWAYPLTRTGSHWTVPLVTLIAIGAAIAIARRPTLARWALGMSIVMALFFNVTVLHIGRYLFPPDVAGYSQARKDALSGQPAVYTNDDEGAFVVASPNSLVQLTGRGNPLRHPKPAWITKQNPR
jgi:uncharacterized membrane protein